MNYGKAFKTIREEQGLSRAEVAKQIGCTPSALSRIVIPKQSTIETFCTMMRVPIAAFYYRAFTTDDFGSVDPIR